MISASALDRTFACPPSAVIRPRADESGAAAERGTVLHEFCRRVGNDPSSRESALECVDLEWRKTAASLDLETALADLEIRGTEEAYALDCATGEVTYLGNNIDRHYEDQCQKLYGRALRSSEVCCSLDVEGMHTDGSPAALDYKSGMSVHPVAEMKQLWLQCYVLAVKYDAHQVHARAVYINPDGSVWLDEHTFSRMELDEFPAQLRKMLADVEMADKEYTAGKLPVLYPGDHCRYCPAARACPVQTTLVKSALLDLTAIDSAAIMMLTPEQVGAAKHKLKQIQPQMERLEKALNAMIIQSGEVPADPGYVYKQTESGRPYMPADLVRGLLVKLGATEEQIQSVTRVSKFPVIKRMKANK